MLNEKIAYKLTALDGSGVTSLIEASTLDEAHEMAGAWAREGDYHGDGFGRGTVWVDVRIEWTDSDGESRVDMARSIAIDPPAPRCARSNEHTWRAVGVWPSGARTRGTDVCAKCGVAKHWDSFAQRPDTGEQGLSSVRYTQAS